MVGSAQKSFDANFPLVSTPTINLNRCLVTAITDRDLRLHHTDSQNSFLLLPVVGYQRDAAQRSQTPDALTGFVVP